MAPKAPIGAAHMIIASTRKTSRWRCPTPRRIGSPARPIACSAKPTSSATSRVCSTSPRVSAENSDVGDDAEQELGGAAVRPRRPARRRRPRGASVRCRPVARVQDVADDQADGQRDRRHDEEVAERQAADLADLGGLRTEPTPSTIVQKMIGWIIILIRRDERRCRAASARRRSRGRAARRRCRAPRRRSPRCRGSGSGPSAAAPLRRSAGCAGRGHGSSWSAPGAVTRIGRAHRRAHVTAGHCSVR